MIRRDADGLEISSTELQKKKSKYTHRIQMLSSEEYLGIINYNSLQILTQCSAEVKRKTTIGKARSKRSNKIIMPLLKISSYSD